MIKIISINIISDKFITYLFDINIFILFLYNNKI